jgi:hypothetical protein
MATDARAARDKVARAQAFVMQRQTETMAVVRQALTAR